MTAALVPAECHSDDHNAKAEFDAAPWLQAADTQAIVDLALCGWGGEYPADRVAQELRGSVPDIDRVLGYVDLIRDDRSKKDCCGFECHVEAGAATTWLKANRPDAYELVSEAMAGGIDAAR